MKRLHAALLLVAGFGGAIVAFAPAVPDPVEYPDGYRRWNHVKSAYRPPAGTEDPESGFMHIYANDLALRGYETGHFADGAVLVFDVLAGVTRNGRIVEADRRRVDVMHKDSVRFGATGGWGFERFRGDTRERVVAERAGAVCFSCHASRSDSGYVFSRYRP